MNVRITINEDGIKTKVERLFSLYYVDQTPLVDNVRQADIYIAQVGDMTADLGFLDFLGGYIQAIRHFSTYFLYSYLQENENTNCYILNE